MKSFHLIIFIILALAFEAEFTRCQAQGSPAKKTEPSPAINLAQVIEWVLKQNLELAPLQAEERALGGRVQQAARRPNPELSAQVENFGGTGAIGFSNYAETTVQLSQRIEIGAKRSWRIRAAEAERQVAAGELLSQKASLLARVSAAYVEVLEAQQRLANRQDLFSLAEKTHQTVSARVQAGKVSPIEESRSTVVLETARLEKGKAVLGLVAVKGQLASFWQGTAQDFETAEGPFRIPSSVSTGSNSAELSGNLEIKQAQFAIEARQVSLSSELAQRKPDLTLGGGFRRLNDYGGSAWVAGISIPLPFFDRRQVFIVEAQQRVEKAQSEKRLLENRQRLRLAQLQQQSTIALQEATSLETSVLPAAQTAMERLEEGYRQGKFEYLPVLDAQRTFFELKSRWIDSIATILKVGVEIQLLTGKIAEPGALNYLSISQEN
jgi:cobalt-zinc-cadmium efflux system outer membrane protein